mgnify:FL=1
MRRHERWRLFATVLFFGILLTLLINSILSEKRRRIAARVALQEGVQGESSLKVGYGYRDFKKKFEDTDRIIALLREREKTEKREADG